MSFSPIFVSLARVNGLTATLYRTSIASGTLLLPFMLQQNNRLGVEEVRPGLRQVLGIVGLGGLLFALNNGFFNTAVTMIPASRATFLANTAVIWVGIFSMLIFHERLLFRFWFGVILALAGVFLITGNFQNGSADGSWLGNLVALTGGFFYGLNILFNGTARRYLNAVAYIVLHNAVSALILLVAVLLVGVQFWGFTFTTYAYLFGLGFLAHGIGFSCVVYSQAHLPPSRVSSILLAQPMLVLILSFIILQERPLVLQLVGMFILFGGIVLANYRNTSLRKET